MPDDEDVTIVVHDPDTSIEAGGDYLPSLVRLAIVGGNFPEAAECRRLVAEKTGEAISKMYATGKPVSLTVGGRVVATFSPPERSAAENALRDSGADF